MILAASFEFEKGHNNEIVNRPSDNEEIPMVIIIILVCINSSCYMY